MDQHGGIVVEFIGALGIRVPTTLRLVQLGERPLRLPTEAMQFYASMVRQW